MVSATPSAPILGFHVTTSSLPNATHGAAYSVQLGATGGATPYKWKKVGTLPKGLKLSSGGLLSGTPKTRDVAKTYSVTVKATTHKSRGHPSQTAAATLSLVLS